MRYQKIYIQIWNDEKFINLSVEGQRFFLYLLTSPHSNLIGFYTLKEGYVVSDLKITQKDFEKLLAESLQKDLIKYDKSTSLLLVKNYLKHNPITNPNQLKAGIKILSSLPKSLLIQEFKVMLEGLQEGLTKGLLEGILYTDTDTDTVSVTAKEGEYEGEKKQTALRQPEIKIFIDFAFKTFSEKFGEKLLIDGGKDGAIIKKLLSVYNLDKLKGLWEQFLQSDDPFILKAGFSIPIFKTQINKLLTAGKVEQREEKPTTAFGIALASLRRGQKKEEQDAKTRHDGIINISGGSISESKAVAKR